MTDAESPTGSRDAPDRQTEFDTYLPGMVRVSPDPGPIERFLTTLFRRREEPRLVVRRTDR